MILRRMSLAIRNQDWFVVFIEFAIVVAGIFAALQADDWNQRRIDRADEERFLVSLHDELVESSNLRRFIIEGHFENHANLKTMLPKVFAGEGDSLTERECYSIFATQSKPNYVLDLPTLNTLLANGRIGIFSEDALQTTLILYRQRVEALQRFTDRQSIFLTVDFSSLFDVTAFHNPSNNDVNAALSCNLADMRRNDGFRAALALQCRRLRRLHHIGTDPHGHVGRRIARDSRHQSRYRPQMSERSWRRAGRRAGHISFD